MNETIYKYPLSLESSPVIDMPTGAHVLCVQVQKGEPCLWAVVDPDQPIETRQFRLCGTGHNLAIDDPKSHYIGTFQLDGGNFIGHVFDYKRR